MKRIDIVRRIISEYSPSISFKEEDDLIYLSGSLDKYQDVVSLGLKIAKTHLYEHVINNVEAKDVRLPQIRTPAINDNSLDNTKVDVLIIGAGVIGLSILRELTKYDLKLLCIDKEDDVGLHASTRNDGNIHVGIDLSTKSKKFYYLNKARALNEKLFTDLDVKYVKTGQTIAFSKISQAVLAVPYLRKKGQKNGVKVKFYFGKEIQEIEPNIAKNIPFAANFAEAGQISPFEYVVALAESAIMNGATISLSTYASSMQVSSDKIISVTTNRGTIYPKVVINAAGAFSDLVAKMAGDQFFSIHPRKGTDIIMDKKVSYLLSKTALGYREELISHSSTKGGGVIPTIDGNSLIGPNAIETPFREDHTVDLTAIKEIMSKNANSEPNLNMKDIITYFSGIRAATYEEDFVVERGRKVKNIVHAAGIQSPGLTAASAIGQDVANIVVNEIFHETRKNEHFINKRKGLIKTNELSLSERDALIKKNPDYGIIVCRCEEISKGEIIDCLNRPLKPTSIDAIKRRVRAGMGRCQGGFCRPLIVNLIAKKENIPLEKIYKRGTANILTNDNKEVDDEH